MTDDDRQDAAPETSHWGVILLAVAGGIAIAFQIGKMPATIPVLERELGLSLVDAGWAISLLYGVAAVTGVAAGAVADRIGVRRVAAAGLVFAAAGSLIGGLATGLWTLLASRLIEGVGAVAMLSSAPGLILRAVQPRDLPLAMGLWGTFMPTGIAVMLLLTPFLLATIGWRGMWFANAALVALFAVWLWFGTRSAADPRHRPGRHGARRSVLGDIGAVLGREGPWLLAGSFALYATTYLCITAFLPKYLIEARGFDAEPAALLTALVIAANTAGNLTGGWLGHRGVPRWLLIAVAISTMGVTGWFVYQPWMGDAMRIAVACLFSFVGGFLPGSVYASAPLHAPQAGKVSGVNGMVLQGTNLGQLTGPPIFAAIVAASTWASGPLFLIGLAVLGLLLAFRIGRIERRLAASGAA